MSYLADKILASYMRSCGAPTEPPVAQGAPCEGGRVTWADTTPRWGWMPTSSNFARLVAQGCQPLDIIYEHGEVTKRDVTFPRAFAAACCPTGEAMSYETGLGQTGLPVRGTVPSQNGNGARTSDGFKLIKDAYPAPMNVPLAVPTAPVGGPAIAVRGQLNLACPDGEEVWLTADQLAAQGCNKLGERVRSGTTVKYRACCPAVVKGPAIGTKVPAAMGVRHMPGAEDDAPGVIEQVAPGKVTMTVRPTPDEPVPAAPGDMLTAVKTMIPEAYLPYTPTPSPEVEILGNGTFRAPPIRQVTAPDPRRPVEPPPPDVAAPPRRVLPGPGTMLAPPLQIPPATTPPGYYPATPPPPVLRQPGLAPPPPPTLVNGNGAPPPTLVNGNGAQAVNGNGINWWLVGGIGILLGGATWYFLRGRTRNPGAVGRRVRTVMGGHEGIIVKWRPMPGAMTDALVEYDNGKRVWHGRSGLKPIDGLGPLPERFPKERTRNPDSESETEARMWNDAEDRLNWLSERMAKDAMAAYSRRLDEALLKVQSAREDAREWRAERKTRRGR